MNNNIYDINMGAQNFNAAYTTSHEYKPEKDKKTLFSIVALAGGVISLIGGLLTLILSAGASYKHVNSIVSDGVSIAKMYTGSGRGISSDTIKEMTDSMLEIVLNVFNWFKTSGTVIIAIIGIVLAAAGSIYILMKYIKKEKISGFQKISAIAGGIAAAASLTVCMTVSLYSNSLNEGLKDMFRDTLDEYYDTVGEDLMEDLVDDLF